jgi:Ser/Thr protein kinase RdoA (MazF antagonist)
LKDFQPDYFSIASINYSSIPLKNLHEIENILKEQFPTIGRILEAKNLSGLDINSSNMKITSETGNYILKYWSSKDLNRINQICRILSHLNSEGITAPVPVVTMQNEFIFEFQKIVYILIIFFE